MGCCRQLRWLLWKNWVVKKRHCVGSFFEILSTVVVMGLLVALSAQIELEDIVEDLHIGELVQLNDLKSTLIFNFDALQTGARIGFAPDTADVRAVAQAFNDTVAAQGFFDNPWCMDGCTTPTAAFTVFEDEQAMLDWVRNEDYGKTPDRYYLNLGVSFKSADLSSYRILQNKTSGGDPNEVDHQQWLNRYKQDWKSFLFEGVQTLQAFVDGQIINRLGGSPVETSWQYLPFPTPQGRFDPFTSNIAQTLPLLYLLAFLYPCARIVKSLVEEKESRMRENMRMMGMQDSVLWASWYITYAIMFFVQSLLVMLVTGGSVYKNSDNGLVFIFFFLFGLSMISFGALVSVFFSRVKTSGTVAYVAIFAAFIPFFVIGDESYSESVKTASSLLPPTAFALGAQTVTRFEGFLTGVTWENVDTPLGNHAFRTSLAMLVVDFFVYGVLALYLDKVVPSQYGTRLHPLFFLQPSYWRGSAASDAPARLDSAGEDEAMEPGKRKTPIEAPPAGLHQAVHVKNLSKTFGQFTAVDNLNLDIFEDQIFALLGHNGAGKSTTINMLTGLLPVSSGSATIAGMDVGASMQDIRHKIGVCPQHDVLYADLTVWEHLLLFAALRGVDARKQTEDLNEMVKDVGLTEKLRTKSKDLSGGMKRKLSVALALLGDAKVVFLDEPTSGMDPYSRRATWNLLNKKKKGRAIIITTHFMDEADILGDRIGIMSDGKLQCCGSSHFLKAAYGIGYTMVLTRDLRLSEDEKHNLRNPEQLVMQCVPEASVLNEVGSEVSFRMPFNAAGQFPALFQELDNNGQAYGISNYGVSVTTLEEVFIDVGRAAQADKDKDSALKRQLTDRRMRHSVSATEQFARANSGQGMDGIELDMVNVQKGGDSEQDPALAAVMTPLQPMGASRKFAVHFSALYRKRFNYAKRDKKALIFQLVVPIAMLIFGLAVLQIDTNFTFPVDALAANRYNTPSYFPFNPQANGTNVFGGSSQTGVVFEDVGTVAGSSLQGFQQWLLDNRNQYPQSRMGAAYMSSPTSPAIDYDFTVGFNTTGRLALPAFQNTAATALLQHVTGGTQQIRAELQRFPLTAADVDLVEGINGFFVALIVAISFSFIPASYATFVVKEREVKAKHIQMISGVSKGAYWLSTYAWDMTGYMVPWLASIIVINAFGSDVFAGDSDSRSAVALVFLLFGLSVAPFSYALSFLFNKHGTAQNILLILYFFSGLLLMLTSFILSLLLSEEDQYIRDSLDGVFRVFPSFCLGNSLLQMATLDESVWELEVVGYNCIYMTVEIFVYMAIVVMLESEWSTIVASKLRSVPQGTDREAGKLIDPDVAAEKERVLSGGASEDVIRLESLRKVYRGPPEKTAVNGMCFGIPQGQCFGFLGINGAGKTTTLSMLAGEQLPTGGSAFLKGYNVVGEQETARQLIGYCPQFDALLDLLTARENLELSARIKGVRQSDIKMLVDTMLDRLTLTQYADKPCGTYSGGNKRKLSVAMALIGNPPIVFLDEPSTGMDPTSRRFMWDFICSTMMGRAVILTTHSMEEAEALCHRIGIMVGGALQCIGSTQRLKDRYGQGYQLEISSAMDHDAIAGMKQFVEQQFPGARLLEEHGPKCRYTIPKGVMTLGQVFTVIEENKERLQVGEYSVSQTSLEQIFIGFASQQEEEKDPIRGFVPQQQQQQQPEQVHIAVPAEPQDEVPAEAEDEQLI